ncbi:uncharacterized protein LOC134407219 isoform X2 [Elgaria multicarinata webbii]|uniref:uncharacterized protein LOC134407219 isoform X2 n=1 Tax=Elgaria multicarinata webbii TaxID=159646 RepID=UPI002FCCC2C8
MGKYVVTCMIAILFILLQTDVIVSVSSRGSSRPSGSSSSGSHRKPSRPVYKPSRPVHQPSRPVHQPSRPVKPPSRPVKPPSRPVNPPSRPVHHPIKPVEKPIKPVHIPDKPVHNEPIHPPNRPGQPAQNPAYPPHNPVNPPQNPANPPPYNPAYPQNPANPPPYNPAYPQNPAYPPHNPVNPPHNPAYPPHNPANPPPYNPANPPHNPAYPPYHPANPPHNPAYPQNPGYPQRNPSYPQNPGWSQYDTKPWKPKPPKPNMKHMAGAAVAGAAVGAAGGFLLGRAMSNMHFRFNNPNEERWWHENRNRYSDQVYYPTYEQPVPEDVFVRDCWNITVREFIEPSENQTADEMEERVVKRVVREMCIEQYRSFSSHAGGGSVGHHDSNPMQPKASQPGMKPALGEAGTDIAVAYGGGYLLGSPLSKMHFPFNDSEEEHWWKENRDRFTHHVYSPNNSRSLSKDEFVSDCVNVTAQDYIKPSGNQTADEMETRIGTRVIHKVCTELYHSYFSLADGGSFAHSNHKPAGPTEPAKLGIKPVAGAAFRGTVAGANGGYQSNSAVSNMHVYFNVVNALRLSSPSMLMFLMLFTCFLIP